jgi:hypothetical protein
LLGNYNELLDIYFAGCVHGLMSAFTSQEVSRKLADFGIIVKYIPFLQDHGFSEFGKGQLIGKMELLKEGLSHSETNRLGQQCDSRISISEVDPDSIHDYEDLSVSTSGSSSIEPPPNLEGPNNKKRNSNDGDRNSMGIKITERREVNSAFNHNREGKYMPENNRWDFKNEDEASWITRIRKLADI